MSNLRSSRTEFSAKAENESSIKRIFIKIAAASLFATVFYFLQEIVQPFLAGLSNGFCCQRCSNIFYDQAQPIYAVCAGAAFLIIPSINLNGWKSVLKMILVGFLCFQPYAFLTFLSAIRGGECSALIFPRGLPLVIGTCFLIVESCLWSLLCVLPITIFEVVLSKRNLSA